jgi:hypothetical protein
VTAAASSVRAFGAIDLYPRRKNETRTFFSMANIFLLFFVCYFSPQAINRKPIGLNQRLEDNLIAKFFRAIFSF